jgi:Tfp pilus assembly protein PilE
MKAVQKIFVILLILSIVLGVFVLLAMPSSTWVKQTNRDSTGVAWLEVCAILETDQMGILTPAKAFTPL